MRGPIDYIIVGFKDAKFDGGVLNALGEALDSGVIALVSLNLVYKDADGTVSLVDIQESGDDVIVEFSAKYIGDGQTANQDDIDEVGELLESGEVAGLLVVEQLWAKPLKQAIVDKGGVLLAEGRIHPEAAEELDEA